MDRNYRDKRIRFTRMGWPPCDGKCHRGVHMGLPEHGCPCALATMVAIALSNAYPRQGRASGSYLGSLAPCP